MVHGVSGPWWGGTLHRQGPSSSRPSAPLRRCPINTELKENHSTPTTPPQTARCRLARNLLKTCPQILFSPALPLSLSPKGLFSVPISPNVLLASELASVQRRLWGGAIMPPFPIFELARKGLVGPILTGLSTLGVAPACTGKHPRACSVGSPSATHESAGAGKGQPASSLAPRSHLGPQPPAGEALPVRGGGEPQEPDYPEQ